MDVVGECLVPSPLSLSLIPLSMTTATAPVVGSPRPLPDHQISRRCSQGLLLLILISHRPPPSRALGRGLRVPLLPLPTAHQASKALDLGCYAPPPPLPLLPHPPSKALGLGRRSAPCSSSLLWATLREWLPSPPGGCPVSLLAPPLGCTLLRE